MAKKQFTILFPAENVIEGVASSGRKDNHGTILDPAGATWKTPLPLLDSHKPDCRLGEVSEIWRDGDLIRFRATLVRKVKRGATAAVHAAALPQPHPGTAAVLGDELDACGFESSTDGFNRAFPHL
jgi:hypothetical protein